MFFPVYMPLDLPCQQDHIKSILTQLIFSFKSTLAIIDFFLKKINPKNNNSYFN